MKPQLCFFKKPSLVIYLILVLTTVTHYWVSRQVEGIFYSLCSIFDLDLHWINAKSNLSFIHGHLLHILQSDFKNYPINCAYKACCKSQDQSVTLSASLMKISYFSVRVK